jgi:hypothetical protein
VVPSTSTGFGDGGRGSRPGEWIQQQQHMGVIHVSQVVVVQDCPGGGPGGGDGPRLVQAKTRVLPELGFYLHGPGGPGKSQLSFLREFYISFLREFYRSPARRRRGPGAFVTHVSGQR